MVSTRASITVGPGASRAALIRLIRATSARHAACNAVNISGLVQASTIEVIFRSPKTLYRWF